MEVILFLLHFFPCLNAGEQNLMKWNMVLVLLCKLYAPVFHHQTPNFHQLALTSCLLAVKMASDITLSSKSSAIFIIISNFCAWSLFTVLCCINKKIEGWPMDQMVVQQKQQNRLHEKECQID